MRVFGDCSPSRRIERLLCQGDGTLQPNLCRRPRIWEGLIRFVVFTGRHRSSKQAQVSGRWQEHEATVPNAGGDRTKCDGSWRSGRGVGEMRRQTKKGPTPAGGSGLLNE